MQEEHNLIENDSEEKEIDLLELAAKLWENRRKLIKWSVCGAVVGLIIAFSIPKEYSTTVKLVPEANDTKSVGGGLASLASFAGLSTGASGADALYPQLYPDVVSSVPFVTSLFDVTVTTKDEGDKYTVSEYLTDETKSPWWSMVLGLPGKVIGLLKPSDSDEKNPNRKVDNFQLTMEESLLVQAINSRVSASVDQKTSVITIDVKMQDPLVSAILADTVVARLNKYITDYRTNKARKDLEYAEKLNEKAKEDYYKAQQTYADYLDKNQGIALHSAQTVRERLQNESSLAFNLYNQTAQQVQKCQAKVQETTPVYTVVTPATVAVKASSPKKMLILVGFTFLAFVACAAWILFISPLIEEQRGKAKLQESGEK